MLLKMSLDGSFDRLNLRSISASRIETLLAKGRITKQFMNLIVGWDVETKPVVVQCPF